MATTGDAGCSASALWPQNSMIRSVLGASAHWHRGATAHGSTATLGPEAGKVTPAAVEFDLERTSPVHVSE